MSSSAEQTPLFQASNQVNPQPKLSSGKLDRNNLRRRPASTIRVSRVLIAGGGFGGLFLAILLDRLGIPFYIFDGGAKIQHLGGALCLGPSVLTVLEQLGLTSILASVSLPCRSLDIYDSKLKMMGSVGMKGNTDATGYEDIVCTRLNLYELLMAQLHPDSIVMGKKILSFEENELGINVCCSDNMIYCGDILVGADGVHSRIRQVLYRTLDKKGLLPRSDKERFTPNYVFVAGVAKQQSPDKYPALKKPFVHLSTVVGPKGTGWHAVNIPDDQICWAMWKPIDKTEVSLEESFENTVFEYVNTESVVKFFRNMPCPLGGHMGELVDTTSEELKSKLLPWAGIGEANEIHDAIVLANCLLELKDLGLKNITGAFRDYYEQRYPRVKSQFSSSRATTKLVIGQSFSERLTRYAYLNWVPSSVRQRMFDDNAAYRPQVSFIPKAENRGTTAVIPMKPTRRWTEEEVSRRIANVWGRRSATI
ncbi:hypothetical protein BGZ65_001429 [Modicella reniformis]|uniref:FAD-binding domain-containing protein n=1 Tax=Modicella reniformis TaxID=1440133 RepID=A0A9P6MLI6_9FUNG|nr:hypothetical protein BGZ65_001429 [Modicella reniformis]